MINYQKIQKFSTGDTMSISLMFPFQQPNNKERRPKKRVIAKIKTEHSPVEIQDMDMPELLNIYEHGSPIERSIAEEILYRRKKAALVDLASPMNSELASGSPFANNIRG